MAGLLQLHLLRSAIGRRRRRLLAFRSQKIVQRVVMVQLLVNSRTVPRPCRQWVRDRSGHWWQHVVPSFTPREWLENFRMSKSTFEYLCDQLGLSFRGAITIICRTQSCNHSLDLINTSRISHHWALVWSGTSTMCVIVHSTCEAIVDPFSPSSLPSREVMHWTRLSLDLKGSRILLSVLEQ